jgi:S-adenosylmethionine hydrolase
MPSLITLTTDFEEREPYAASAKGVLYARCPGATVVDLTHQIRQQDVAEAALFLVGAVPFFPEGSVHLVAVASGARPVAVSLGGQFVVCPDNGVLTMLADQTPIDEVCAVTDPGLNLSAGGQTYYARDVFAPTAAMIAQHGSLSGVGERLDDIVRLNLPRPQRKSDRVLLGQIIHVNRFGSLVTNIHRSVLQGRAVSSVMAGDFPIGQLSNTYADVPQGRPLALYGSSGYLEIAYNGDQATKRLNMREGILITLQLEPPA